jgi:hypothetical protein
MKIFTNSGSKAGMRDQQYKVQKNGVIMSRVVGKGSMFTWCRYGTLPPGMTAEQWWEHKSQAWNTATWAD